MGKKADFGVVQGLAGMKRVICLLLILASAMLCALGCNDKERCVECVPVPDVDGNEPPPNPFLADSPWPMTHRNPYCQASSPYPGPTDLTFNGELDFMNSMPALITVAFSGPYPDGSRVIWGSNQVEVFKANPAPGGSYYDRKLKEDVDFFNFQEAISGAYTVLDREGTFFVPRFERIIAYGDTEPGNPLSKIEVKGDYEIPDVWLHGEDDLIVGLNMTFDGMLAFATRKGTVGVVSRSFDEAHFLHLGEDEEISNSIACDEDGGIYAVTSRRMIRVQWTGLGLTTEETRRGWSAGYETGEDHEGIRLGKGSGATPTLMGTGGPDKFVVITDGQALMHIVLFWRDEIPSDWVQIPGTRDRRIAAQVPVRFGDPSATVSLSEQSVCVRGYGALVVNNQLQIPLEDPLLAILLSGLPFIAPRGAEKFEWDPRDREFRSVWVNREISFPNGIQSMSAATNLIYNMGQRNGVWTMEALNWSTGESVSFCEIGRGLEYNSAYAGTEVGIASTLYSGTLFGMVRVQP